MAQDVKAKGLGRGLSALLGETSFEPEGMAGEYNPQTLPIEFLKANPNQVRKVFDDNIIEELAASIREKGVLQPLIVRPIEGQTNLYEIVAGERRWRAAQKAALHELPVIIKNLDDREAFELSLIENIQRADLNPIEEAMGYRALIDQFQHTQEELAGVVGKSRSHITNSLRLLSLPEQVLEMIGDGSLSAGHARTLIGIDNLVTVAKKVVEKGLSVRQTEALVRALKSPQSERGRSAQSSSKKREKDPDILALEKKIAESLGLSVSIEHHDNEGGRIEVSYKSLEQLDEVCRRLCLN